MCDFCHRCIKKPLNKQKEEKNEKMFNQLLTPPIQDQQLIQIDIFQKVQYSGVYLHELIYNMLIKIKFIANETSTLLFILNFGI